MFQFRLDRRTTEPCTILCLGAHSDDIEIGCGGTLLRLLSIYPNAQVWWVVFTAAGVRRREARASAVGMLRGSKQPRIVLKAFRESFLPYHGEQVKGFFEELKRRCSPDLIFTHYRHDLHQDHRVISEFTWNTFRNHLILEYEIPKYDGDLGVPNTFVALDAETCRRKVDHLFSHFATQRNKQWFSEDLFYALMRLRGVEANASSKYAEAFYSRKLVL
ncbi:MAG: PIG-L deacetylase family protein [Nitrospira sp.]